jgi:uncharacterized phage infection (PIP) family protein YhgE
MEIKDEKDFPLLREQVNKWNKNHSMFKHDVRQLSKSLEKLIDNHSQHMIMHRQTKRTIHLERAQAEIDNINILLKTVGQQELLSILSRR